MNLLAHAILSPPDPGILTGNLVADWVKGRHRKNLPEDLRRGMLLHRHIDTFTDTHALVDRCSALLAAKWNRYSGILVDMFFDHVLAASWHRHHREPLPQFAAQTYATVGRYQHLLPELCNHAIVAMTMDDWFNAYASLDGIRLSLSRMSHRLRSRGHDVELAPAVDDFFDLRPEFQSAFNSFFPQLQLYLATLNLAPVPAEILA